MTFDEVVKTIEADLRCHERDLAEKLSECIDFDRGCVYTLQNVLLLLRTMEG